MSISFLVPIFSSAQTNPNRQYVWTADCFPVKSDPRINIFVIKTNLADAMAKRLPARGLAVISGSSYSKFTVLINLDPEGTYSVYNSRGTFLSVDTKQTGIPKGDRVVLVAKGGNLLQGIELSCEFKK